MHDNERPLRIRDHHVFLEAWLTPWSWLRPGIWRSRTTGKVYGVCFGFGKLELVVD